MNKVLVCGWCGATTPEPGPITPRKGVESLPDISSAHRRTRGILGIPGIHRNDTQRPCRPCPFWVSPPSCRELHSPPFQIHPRLANAAKEELSHPQLLQSPSSADAERQPSNAIAVARVHGLGFHPTSIICCQPATHHRPPSPPPNRLPRRPLHDPWFSW